MADVMKRIPLPQEGSILYEKPQPVKEGKAFKQKVVVQRRSDMLLEEQIENVKNVQDALKSALHELETTKNPEEMEFIEQQVGELKEKSDQMIVVLKIVQKLNTELQYARADLVKMLKDGDSDEINRTRKRVGWLEDRMEQTLGKKRQRSAHRAASLVPDPRSMLQSERNKIDRGYMSDYSSYIPRDHSIRSSTESPLHRATHHITDDSEVSYPLPLQPKVEDIQRDILEDDSKPVTRHAPREHVKYKPRGDMPLPPTHIMGQDNTFVTQYPPDTPYSGRPGYSPELSSASPLKSVLKHTTRETDMIPSQDDSSSVLSSDAQKVLPPIGVEITSMSVPSQAPQLQSEEVSSEKQETTEETSSEVTTEEQTDRTQESEITAQQEESSVKSKQSERSKEGSRVTIASPAEELFLIEEYPALGEAKDAAKQYWESEHHRFEYTEFADNITDNDPTSYHSVGLAVPGSFVQQVNDANSKLPWRERTTSELSDVHPNQKAFRQREADWKIALDKLSVKVHKMYGRVKEASLLSVRPEVETKKGPSILLQALEIPEERTQTQTQLWGRVKNITAADGPETPSTLPLKPTLAKFGLKPMVEEVTGFPDVNTSGERLGTSMSGRLVYRPNPLPYPDKLAVTKVSKTKEYPPLSDSYSKSVPGQDMPPDRMVDQRNLLNETKFTSSLFKSKVKKKSLDTESVETETKPKPAVVEKEHDRKKKKHRKKKIEEPQKPDIRSTFNMAKAAVKFRGMERWKDMKPKSGALRHTGLKWERVKSIVHNNLTSSNVEERTDAARHLGLLRVCDTMVLYALRERVQNDSEKRVVYEAAKSLVALGSWEEEVVNLIVVYLLNGNTHIRADLIKTMIFAKNVQYIDKRMKSFPDLVKILSIMCKTEEPEDRMSFDAAVCLGRMCVYDTNGRNRLKLVIDESKDTHMKAEALDILIRQMNMRSPDVVLVLVDQLTKSSVWKYRMDACKLLIHIGPKYALPEQVIGDRVYDALERKLWDDPNMNVRFESAKALAALDLYPYACEKVEKKLEDSNEEIRAQAVISVGTLGMKNERVLRHLLEMIDLDSSEYVRLMIIRSFSTLNCLDKRVLRVLADKEKGEGILSREAKKAIEYLDVYAQMVEYRKHKKKHKSRGE